MPLPTLALLWLALLSIATGTPLELFTYNVGEESATITGFQKGADGDVVIPARIDGRPVTRIENWSFANCTRIESIYIPDTVTAIGANAFVGCRGIGEVRLSENLVYLGPRAFAACSSLRSIVIPASLQTVGDLAFLKCSRLASVHIPYGVQVLSWGAFGECRNLMSVNLPSSIINLGDAVFYKCAGLREVTFLGNAPVMGTQVFSQTHGMFTIRCLEINYGFETPEWLGYPCEYAPFVPEIEIQQPLGKILRDGTALRTFGSVKVGKTSAARVFTVYNNGTALLGTMAIRIDGPGAKDFKVQQLPTTVLSPSDTFSFKVNFKPRSKGTREAVLHFKSNDPARRSFEIRLSGTGR